MFALPAAAQLDSAALRAKYGNPLNREPFHTPQGSDVAVDCGAGITYANWKQPNVSGAFNPKQQMQDFLPDLVPSAMLGKELDHGKWVNGGTVVGPGETITMQFKNVDCRR